jgi:hypothetical protein
VRAARLFDQIAHQVETERALLPQAEVPLSFLGQRKMGEALRGLHAGDGRHLARLPYTVLGLLPDADGDWEAQAPASIYVVEQEQLFVSLDRPEDDADTQALLAHAYVHALQDQHFDLEALRARAGTTDERLAVQALIEGDATLVTGLYRSRDLSSVDWEQLIDLIVEAEQPVRSAELTNSETWARLQRFPNDEGKAFAHDLFERGKWDAINQSYTRPPRSTEQILHPSRYPGLDAPDAQPDQPSTVTVPDLSPVLGEAWRLVLRDTLGEFVIGLHLSQVMGEETAWRRADGWDGDTLLVWEREDGDRMVVWRTLWDTSADAAEFERGLKLLIPQTHSPVRLLSRPRGLPGEWWETALGTVQLRRAGRYVLLVRAPDTNTVVNGLERLP